jgi:hypothetical protein
VPLELVVAQTGAIERSLGLLRSRDAITPYMYLPQLDDVLVGEHVACLFRPTLVSDELLREPPRRVAQLQAPAPPSQGQARRVLEPCGDRPERPPAPRTQRGRACRRRLATQPVRPGRRARISLDLISRRDHHPGRASDIRPRKYDMVASHVISGRASKSPALQGFP